MQPNIQFSKMHGLGNDFIIIDAIQQTIPAEALQQAVPKLANRYLGIGCDQLLVIEPSDKADFFCRIFNADGSEAEQCGNGLRCVARFVHEKKLTQTQTFSLETKAGVYPIKIENYDNIHVTMGKPVILENLKTLEIKLAVSEESNAIPVSILSVGNPHAIVKVGCISVDVAKELGSHISTNDVFPQGANVGFMHVINPHHIRLRTFERGVGLTHACGSNACAAVVAGISNGWLKEQVRVEYDYGSLEIAWAGGQHPIHMTGPATLVYAGEIILR
jgi:diaminopimelate epimerase